MSGVFSIPSSVIASPRRGRGDPGAWIASSARRPPRNDDPGLVAVGRILDRIAGVLGGVVQLLAGLLGRAFLFACGEREGGGEEGNKAEGAGSKECLAHAVASRFGDRKSVV